MAREVDIFQRALLGTIAKMERRSNAIGEELKRQLEKEVVDRTPVKTGTAKEGWEFVDPSRAIQEVQNVDIEGFKMDAAVLQNNVFYTQEMFAFPGNTTEQWGLEGGRDQDAPIGMVGPGTEQIANDWDKTVQDILNSF